MSVYKRAILLTTIAMGLLSFFGCGKRGLDESVLMQLKKVGSDLSKPHNVDFFLYFPTQAVAEQAAARVKASGFEVQVQPSPKDSTWLCGATKKMVPELQALQKIRTDFNHLAGSLGGKYDGWGTEVEK